MRLLELETDDVVKDPEGKCTEKNINMKRKQFKIIADVAINTHTLLDCELFSVFGKRSFTEMGNILTLFFRHATS